MSTFQSGSLSRRYGSYLHRAHAATAAASISPSAAVAATVRDLHSCKWSAATKVQLSLPRGRSQLQKLSCHRKVDVCCYKSTIAIAQNKCSCHCKVYVCSCRSCHRKVDVCCYKSTDTVVTVKCTFVATNLRWQPRIKDICSHKSVSASPPPPTPHPHRKKKEKKFAASNAHFALATSCSAKRERQAALGPVAATCQ